MFSRLMEVLEEKQILCYKQFDFKKCFSNYAILTLLETIQKALVNGQLGYRFFIDLEKAFNTVSHDVLLDKMIENDLKLLTQVLSK